MKILLVIDQYDDMSNEVAASAKVLVEQLKRNGHVVSILSTGKEAPEKVVLEEGGIPRMQRRFFEENHLITAKPDRRSMKRAIKGQDIVYFYYPFKVSEMGLELCEELHVPCVAGFYLFPEDIASTRFGENRLYNKFRLFYNEFEHVLCQSEIIKAKLEEHGFESKMHVISRGISEIYHYRRIEKPERFQERVVITSLGSLSGEDNQETLIKAIKLSKYSKYIHLILEGQGAAQDRYEHLLNKLHVQYTLKAFDDNELRDVLSYTDLYVYTGDKLKIDIPTLKAIAMGNVPIINDCPESASKAIAIDERSLYSEDDEQDLANKIDYWIEHQTELGKMRDQYAKKADKYRLKESIELVEKLFAEAIQDHLKRDYIESIETVKEEVEEQEEPKKREEPKQEIEEAPKKETKPKKQKNEKLKKKIKKELLKELQKEENENSGETSDSSEEEK